MPQFGRLSWIAIFLSLLLLRFAIGFHFFTEGADKLRSGNFSAAPFLSAAKGPFATHYHRLLEDESGQVRLCVVSVSEGRENNFQVDPELTIAIWGDFVDRAASYFPFDDAQLSRAQEIFKAHREELDEWLASHQSELIAHYSTGDRLDGFAQDGTARHEVALNVASVRGQVDRIRADRSRQLQQWTRQIEEMWDSLEQQVNSVYGGSGKPPRKPIALHRPYSQTYSKLKIINAFIPWFDIIVGGLLILGLMTRLASIAGIGFLTAVIASQPPWIPGAAPTIYQTIELLALLVICATCAGRIGGLDFFIDAFRTGRTPLVENADAT
jgi:uncharacterized membrane protein YphA (DoxX/SURF4 family)